MPVPLTIQAHEGMICALEFSPDGRRLATAGGADLTARIWDPLTGSLVAQLPAGEKNPNNGAELQQFYVEHLAFSPDSRRLVTCALRTKVWNVATGREEGVIEAKHTVIPVVAFSPDGKTLAQGGWSQGLWDVRTLTFLRTLWGGKSLSHVGTLAFTPDGSYLVSAGLNNTVTRDRAHLVLWDVDTGTPRLDLGGTASSLKRAILAADGRLLVGWFQGDGDQNAYVKGWSIPGGKERFSLGFPPHSLLGMTLSPDNRSLALETWGGRVRVWSLPEGRERPIAIVPHHGVESMAFSPDGKVLAFLTVRWSPRRECYDPLLELWDPFTGRELLDPPLRLPPVEHLHSHIDMRIAFSPDGTRLAAALHSGELLIFDVASLLRGS